MKTLLRNIIWLVLLAPAVYLAVVWNKIPATVPTHFDIHGNADGYSSRESFQRIIVALIIINAGVYLIVSNIYRIDPKKTASLNKDRMQRMGLYVCAYLSAISMMVIYASMHNDPSVIMKFVFIAMGLLFALIGSNMYNIKPNYFAGMRLPWTLESEDNWRRTHRLAGKLWFFGGLCIALTAFIFAGDSALYVSAVIMAAIIIIPVIYSYRIYKNQTNKL
ncbi:SdpI family protein [Parafilimonas terrae]|jgi:uncharacterized membrane protein|uniref:Uncharacterized membrane protein n=1 Tax=Parafilimonas terrae TaxID=1465490 RepID=A0A1I5X1V8_9BACT|nr:SdpI family protein [Parafilimonas terrae]SFQ25995.1 Uncharacterized membrane protein [Parafilimonas terrae]